MRTYDDKRWVKNEDGSFSRIPPSEPDQLPGAIEVTTPEAPNENYYKDIATTGAAADLAAELGVDLSEVEGTGLHGKITKADVEAAAKS